MKSTKISYVEMLFIVRFKQDSGLSRVRSRGFTVLDKSNELFNGNRLKIILMFFFYLSFIGYIYDVYGSYSNTFFLVACYYACGTVTCCVLLLCNRCINRSRTTETEKLTYKEKEYK